MLSDKKALSKVILLAVGLLISLFSAAQPLKIACIGNSVTFGYGLTNPSQSYPSVLQNLLGEKYVVRNFGFSGATLLKNGHNPYYKTKAFSEALNFTPDIAIIDLGLNDTDPRNWPNYRDDFEADYAWLIDSFKKNNPKIKIYICKLTPIFSDHPRFKSGTRDWYWQIQKLIPEISVANGVSLIDLNLPLCNRPDLFVDSLHPDQDGAVIIAQTIYKRITGNYGKLKLSEIFADHMVLQRNKPIVISGTANAGKIIRVSFGQNQLTAKTNDEGKWQVQFPARTHGGPLELIVNDGNESVVLKDILIGDVWLCSGQSNMVFPLKSTSTGAVDLKSLEENPLLRILKYNLLAETNDVPWDSTTLNKINQLQYFDGKWQNATAENLADFSAVGYYFGKKIQDEEHVPIGLIQMAVGGSIVEAWIDRATIEHDDNLINFLNNWRQSDFVQEWVRKRADVNLKNAANPKQRHPYGPAYNYEAGIAKLIDFPIKGVIWYQGESNAQNPEQYQHSFLTLINSWRQKWHNSFPFYYVQLSGINRAEWPNFRSIQNDLQYILPNLGMAVSYDLGDSLNVHPVNKKPIGNRLALIALHKTYGKKNEFSGPVPLSVKKEGHQLMISFSHDKDLKTSDNKALTGFEMVNLQGERIEARGIIYKQKVYLNIPDGQIIKKILYAWQPFTRANLVNGSGLPASTFSIAIK
ncbi:sialate O-acetylesterase [Pedobacter chinensis]|uniref:Sialate O-acetylesterase n=1 Tax=Pedobacter chinensis TaxID=2282421 RepID=A0A369Q3S5_9SPHI|nr:GDSL-type esterase/lipase family protein [Pedobacter chinensis]RDC57917.1 sialate O-acetylesterase [Pedobacter chinensis]